MFFEICLFAFVIYSFISQIYLLFSHTFDLGLCSISEYPDVVEREEKTLRMAKLLAMGNVSYDDQEIGAIFL